jgi:hypothetical protein
VCLSVCVCVSLSLSEHLVPTYLVVAMNFRRGSFIERTRRSTYKTKHAEAN